MPGCHVYFPEHFSEQQLRTRHNRPVLWVSTLWSPALGLFPSTPLPTSVILSLLKGMTVCVSHMSCAPDGTSGLMFMVGPEEGRRLKKGMGPQLCVPLK
jgi:hypothetical protein